MICGKKSLVQQNSRLGRIVLTFVLAVLVSFVSTAVAHDDEGGTGINGSSGAGSGGSAGFARSRVELLSHLELDEIGNLGASNVIGNDIWGWTDAASGREFALFGLTNGTSFIEVTDPTAPTYLGTLRTTEGLSLIHI